MAHIRAASSASELSCSYSLETRWTQRGNSSTFARFRPRSKIRILGSGTPRLNLDFGYGYQISTYQAIEPNVALHRDRWTNLILAVTITPCWSTSHFDEIFSLLPRQCKDDYFYLSKSSINVELRSCQVLCDYKCTYYFETHRTLAYVAVISNDLIRYMGNRTRLQFIRLQQMSCKYLSFYTETPKRLKVKSKGCKFKRRIDKFF